MIKIEVTGNSLAEVSDKLLAIGASLQRTVSNDADNAAREALQAERDAAEAPKRTRKAKPEVAEEAPADPTPAPSAEAAVSTKTVDTDTHAPAAADDAPANKELVFDVDVAPLVLRKVQSAGKPAVSAVLEQFGVERASQLEPARWPELVALLEDLG